MRTVLLLAAGVLSAWPQSPLEIRPAPGNRVELFVEKTGFLSGKKHLFVFEDYRGVISYNPAAPESSSVSFQLKSAAIVCKDTWVSAKNLAKVQETAQTEMLAAGRYPVIEFISTAIHRKSSNSFEVQGQLTIRDISKPAVVLVGIQQESGGTLRFEGQSVVRMTEYGLKPPSAAFGTIGTKDQMTFQFSLAARTPE